MIAQCDIRCAAIGLKATGLKPVLVGQQCGQTTYRGRPELREGLPASVVEYPKLGTYLAEAVAAIDRANARGSEGYLRLVATVGTRCRIHLPGAGAATTLTPAALLAGLPVIRTPARLVSEPTAGVEFLLSSRKDECFTTICTNQLFILCQWTTSVEIAGSGWSSNGKEDKRLPKRLVTCNPRLHAG